VEATIDDRATELWSKLERLQIQKLRKPKQPTKEPISGGRRHGVVRVFGHVGVIRGELKALIGGLD
jgi:hypothetical protein